MRGLFLKLFHTLMPHALKWMSISMCRFGHIKGKCENIDLRTVIMWRDSPYYRSGKCFISNLATCQIDFNHFFPLLPIVCYHLSTDKRCKGRNHIPYFKFILCIDPNSRFTLNTNGKSSGHQNIRHHHRQVGVWQFPPREMTRRQVCRSLCWCVLVSKCPSASEGYGC